MLQQSLSECSVAVEFYELPVHGVWRGNWRCCYRVLHRLNHTPSLVNKYHYIWEKLLERKNFILFNTYELCKKLNSTEISTRNQIHFYRIVFRTKYLNIAVEYTNHFKIFTGNIFPESSCYRVIPRFSHRLLEPSSVTKPVKNSVREGVR